MPVDLRLEFGRPSHGWLPLTVRSGGLRLEFYASDVPTDSVDELACAISLLLKGADTATVTLHEEPRESEFHFVSTGESTRFAIAQFEGRARAAGTAKEVFSIEAPTLELCAVFWRALRKLQHGQSLDEFETAWRRRFPIDKVAEVGDLLRQRDRA